MNKKEKNMIYILYEIYYGCLILASIFCYKNQYPGIIMAPVASVTCLLLPLLFKFLKLKITFWIWFYNILFIFIANVCGSMLNGYQIDYFDKILHITSGILISELSFMIFLILFKKIQLKKNDFILCILFVNSMNMMIAVFWEFIEFACLIFLNNDAIHHYSSGVYDCMQDMLVAFGGGLFITFMIILYFKTNKENIFMKRAFEFYYLNVHEDFYKDSR